MSGGRRLAFRTVGPILWCCCCCCCLLHPRAGSIRKCVSHTYCPQESSGVRVASVNRLLLRSSKMRRRSFAPFSLRVSGVEASAAVSCRVSQRLEKSVSKRRSARSAENPLPRVIYRCVNAPHPYVRERERKRQADRKTDRSSQREGGREGREIEVVARAKLPSGCLRDQITRWR